MQKVCTASEETSKERIIMTTIVSFGGGVNSTAMIFGLIERDIRPDAIVFADTGGEKPETYDFVLRFREMLSEKHDMNITVVAYSDKLISPLGVDFACGSAHTSLEDECRNNGTLPSKAFGFGGCSQKWKRYPMDKFVNHYMETNYIEQCVFTNKGALRGFDPKVTRLIGIHAGETRRGKIPDDFKFHYKFPLKEWVWSQQECHEAIVRHGFDIPEKSACFFCPSMRKPEVIQLATKHPELMDRAIDMEHNAKECDGLQVVKGLGRHWTWEGLVKADAEQLRLFDDCQAPICDTCVDW